MESELPNGDAVDPFIKIADEVFGNIKSLGGKASFSQMEIWAERQGIGKYTLRTVVNDLVEEGKLKAPEGYYDNGEDLEPPMPRVVEILNVPAKDLLRIKDYLRDYWSVGMLRLFEDMSRSGMNDVDEALKSIIGQGFAEITNSGVVNATGKLLKEADVKRANLSEFIKL